MTHPAGTLRIKRVYDPADDEDGTRVLVDRLWPRGLTKERAAVDIWLKEIAPSTELRKQFGHMHERWDEFRREYRGELGGNKDAVERLADLAAKGTVTLLYGARDQERNHAVVLLEYMNEKLKRDSK
jgi:uncharacterized protein YeaO (DUF488 family)